MPFKQVFSLNRHDYTNKNKKRLEEQKRAKLLAYFKQAHRRIKRDQQNGVDLCFIDHELCEAWFAVKRGGRADLLGLHQLYLNSYRQIGYDPYLDLLLLRLEKKC